MLIPFSLPSAQYPVMGPSFKKADAVYLDLSVTGEVLNGVDLADQQQLHAAIWKAIDEGDGTLGFGGYLEHRGIYRASPHFLEGAVDRSLHLGVDLWAPAGQEVYAPLDGTVHSLAMNAQPLDYGATIILQHDTGAGPFFTLYGHLSKADLHWSPGDTISAGTAFCHLGEPHENGGWVPHLHFQVMFDMGEHQGDFPGVAPVEERKVWAARCPDPMQLINFAS